MPDTPHTLVLFDVDGTLVDCGVAAGKCFSTAFHEAFGVPCPIFPPDEVAGLTDMAILLEVVRRLNINCDDFERRRDLAFEIYARNLAREFALQPARELPGASRAVQAVRALPDCVTGLLTGSTEATAKIKLESAGIHWDHFICGAYSEDGERRESLPPAARDRFFKMFGKKPDVTVIVGDTPRDVKAALATGCEFIGVTTGHYSRASLEEAGARIILNDLRDTAVLSQVIQAMRR